MTAGSHARTLRPLPLAPALALPMRRTLQLGKPFAAHRAHQPLAAEDQPGQEGGEGDPEHQATGPG
jgi:hypothetical protein